MPEINLFTGNLWLLLAVACIGCASYLCGFENGTRVLLPGKPRVDRVEEVKAHEKRQAEALARSVELSTLPPSTKEIETLPTGVGVYAQIPQLTEAAPTVPVDIVEVLTGEVGELEAAVHELEAKLSWTESTKAKALHAAAIDRARVSYLADVIKGPHSVLVFGSHDAAFAEPLAREALAKAFAAAAAEAVAAYMGEEA